MLNITFPYTFPVPPLNKGTPNPPKIKEPSGNMFLEQGTFGRSLISSIIESMGPIIYYFFDVRSLSRQILTEFLHFADALMELEFALFTHWFVNPNEKSNK